MGFNLGFKGLNQAVYLVTTGLLNIKQFQTFTFMHVFVRQNLITVQFHVF